MKDEFNSLNEKSFNLEDEEISIYLQQKEGLIRTAYPETIAGMFTLADIYEEYQSFDGLIYVFADGGLSGEIYRCNNYGKGNWQKYAITQGYA